ncbi:MAG: tripartite tricarboxylate transporter substrate-binding protein [Proteobacteria bacterium]|nr:tripartite tricarboxylate transporter substrate-binding protein [Pseudomonadota bacterium]
MHPIALALALAGLLSAAPASAQPYPAKSVRYIVGFTPGTATDIVARLISSKLTERWGQQVVVDTRVGAAGTISVAMAARSEPDGYTLYMASSTMVVSPFFMEGITYDIFRDFAPVVLMVGMPTVLAVPPQLNLNSVRDLVTLAKSKPGLLNYAHSGRGTGSHIAAEVLSMLAGIEMTEVSFKSSTDAMNGVVRNEIAVYYPNLAAVMPYMKTGRVKALAVSSAKRSPAAPELPSMAETLPGFDSASFYGIVVPAKTPQNVIKKLNADIVTILNQPEVRERLLVIGADVVAGGPEALTARMQAEREQVLQVVKRIEAKEGKR